MLPKRPRLALIATLALTLCLMVALGAGAAEAKKKKKKGGPSTVDITNASPIPIPDRGPGATGLVGVARSTIVVGNQFKGKRIRDVNATIQATGTGTNAIADLQAVLTAPNGATSTLFAFLAPGNLLGPLTLDDESINVLGFGPPSPTTPQIIFTPWQGIAQPFGFPGLPLSVMDDGPVTGTWTLTVEDFSNGDTSVLNSWRLQVATGLPFKTK